MRIKRFQGGGFATFTPIINAPPSSTPTTSTKPEKENKKNSSSILDDETYKELVTKGGLVNDVNAFVDNFEYSGNDEINMLDENVVNELKKCMDNAAIDEEK